MQTATQETTHVDPSKLTPDFDNIPGNLQADEYTFWLGVTRDCPAGQIDVAGLHFPRSEERIAYNESGKQVRVPENGAINMTVTRHHFRELVKVLPRLVIRVTKPVEEERGTGENIGEPVQRAKGVLVKIPSEAMVAGAVESGRNLKPYVKQPGDRPASEFMYFMYAPTGVRGHEPVTIAEAGLEWPEELQLVEELLS